MLLHLISRALVILPGNFTRALAILPGNFTKALVKLHKTNFKNKNEVPAGARLHQELRFEKLK